MSTENLVAETVHRKTPIWLVWNPELGVIAVNWDEGHARRNAWTASTESPGKTFEVLRKVCSYETAKAIRTEYDVYA